MSGQAYYQHIEITDFGPYITKVILCLNREVTQESLSPDQFSVYTEILDKEGKLVRNPLSFLERDTLVPSKGYREVTDIYPSDRMGIRAEKGTCITLELAYGPIYACSSALTADFSNINGHEFYTDSKYVITQVKPMTIGGENVTGLVFDHCSGVRNPAVDLWLHGESTHPTHPLRYGYYVPQTENAEKHPLIVWLHGAGEGGFDTAISYSGNKVTALTYPEMQAKFGGAYIFSPQCPTMWLDDGSGEYGLTGKSMYVEPLKYAIDEFIRRNALGIDTDRIYVGGDSNGGFMTMRMILDYPDFFAGAFPICEALLDAVITDEEIAGIRDLPIWFTHSNDDPVVLPKDYVLPTYNRLLALGAKQVHLTYWDGIYDLHQRFWDEDGKPWRYIGHFAWIPVLNDDCKLDYDGKPVVLNGQEVTLFDWLAAQHR